MLPLRLLDIFIVDVTFFDPTPSSSLTYLSVDYLWLTLAIRFRFSSFFFLSSWSCQLAADTISGTQLFFIFSPFIFDINQYDMSSGVHFKWSVDMIGVKVNSPAMDQRRKRARMAADDMRLTQFNTNRAIGCFMIYCCCSCWMDCWMTSRPNRSQ